MSSVNDQTLYDLSATLGEMLSALGQSVAVAESCTGGWLAKCLTDVPGSSRWFEQGFVVYSNDAKEMTLDVSDELLADHGAVSDACVKALVHAAQMKSQSDCAIAVSGICGPGGGSEARPVGTVWIAWQYGQATYVERYEFSGNRDGIRRQTVCQALQGLIERLRT